MGFYDRVGDFFSGGDFGLEVIADREFSLEGGQDNVSNDFIELGLGDVCIWEGVFEDINDKLLIQLA